MSTAGHTILDFAARVLPEQFAGDSWATWRTLLRGMFALPAEAQDLEIFEHLTGRSSAPDTSAREVWAIVGRRGGKSSIAALIAVFLTTCRSYDLAVGERGVFMVLAADRRQARVVRRYIGGLLHAAPVLRQLIASETKTEIRLTNGLSIEIHTSSFRTVRGYTVVGAICDEIAFWPTEDAAEPDREILAALRPAMATVPGAMLICLSSPYARRGELYRAYRDHYGKAGDILVIKAPTRELNSTVQKEVIARAYQDDEASARAEYGAEFRQDVEGFISTSVIDAVVEPERRERPPLGGVRGYKAFIDFAGGSGADSATLAIAHQERSDGVSVGVLDAVREVRPPFSPEQVCRDFAELMRRYRIGTAIADRYAADWPRERMAKYGIRVKPSGRTKSEIYRELLPLINSGLVSLLDLPRLRAQLARLERKVARGGRDSIDHAPGQHDDVANAVAGALVEAALRRRKQRATWGRGRRREGSGSDRSIRLQRQAWARVLQEIKRSRQG